MTLHNREETFTDTPFLLDGGQKRYYLHRRAGSGLFWQESEGPAWKEARPLSRQGDCYCAALDSGRVPHLVLVDNGDFYHLVLHHSQPREHLFYREEGKLCSNLLLGGDRQESLHLIYLAVDESARRWWLLHHRFNGAAWEEPRVIDFGGGISDNYASMALDNAGGMHLAYRIIEPDQVTLYYRYFSPESLTWSKAYPLGSAAAVRYPAVFIDSAQNLHVIWSSVKNSEHLVNYRVMVKAGWPSGGWKPEVVISPALAEAPLTFFSYQRGELNMGWLEGAAVSLYRLGRQGWEKAGEQQLEQPVLMRCCAYDAQGTPLFYHLPVQGGAEIAPELAEVPGAAPEGVPQELDLEPDFEKLRQYSGNLIHKASSLSTSKSRLEQALEEKKKELSWIARQNEKTVHELRQNLSGKDKEMQELQEKFNQSLGSVKAKTEQARKQWEAEKKRLLGEMQELRKERQQFERVLKEKENTIARLEMRCREQDYRTVQLREENEALAARVRDSGWSIKKLLGKVFQIKP